MIVRVMMFQSSFTEIGITGWMLRMFCVPFSGPKLRLVLFWNGRLIRLPTGFCASFASSSALISACAGAAASSAPAASAVISNADVANFAFIWFIFAFSAVARRRSPGMPA